MSTITTEIVGLLTDSALASVSQSDYNHMADDVFGLDDTTANFFPPTNNHGVLLDPRFGNAVNQRLYPSTILEHSTGALTRVSVSTGQPFGQMQIHYDKSKVVSEVSAAIENDLKGTDHAYLSQLFGLIECIYTTFSSVQDGSSVSYMPTTVNMLESYLAPSNSSYKPYSGYVEKSLWISSAVASCKIYCSTAVSGSELNNVKVPCAFGFTFNTASKQYIFSLYLDHNLFRTEYPHTTIDTVVYPIPPDKLVFANLITEYGNVANAIGAMSGYVNNSLSDTGATPLGPIAAKDHSGYVTWSTNYTKLANVANNSLVFGFLYRGRTPTASECRDALKTDLINKLGMEEDDIIELLPGLAVQASFYIVPLYDTVAWANTIVNGQTTQSRVIYRSLVPYEDIAEKALGKIGWGSNNNAIIKQHGEIILLPGVNMFAYVVPCFDNPDSKMDLSQIVKNYQAIDSTSPNWTNTMSTLEKALAQMLATAIQAALGYQSAIGFGQNDQVSVTGSNGRYYQFSIGSNQNASTGVGGTTASGGNVYQFFVMTRESYNA